MTAFFVALAAAISGAISALLMRHYNKPQNSPISPEPHNPPPQPQTPVLEPNTASQTPSAADFSTARGAFHATRVLCDQAGLTLEEKNLICACIYQESQFHNGATNQNKNKEGFTTSTDWGLCQINDYFHIGPRKDFPSVDYVLKNPDMVVKWMIHMYKEGHLKQWVSYSSGAYKKWLSPLSPMWLLKIGQ